MMRRDGGENNDWVRMLALGGAAGYKLRSGGRRN